MISVPQDGGRVMKYESRVDFEILLQADQDALYARGGTDKDLLERVVVGWAGGQFEDGDGAPLPYNEQSKAKLFDISYVRQAFIAAYLKAFTGQDAQRKN